MVTPTKNIAVAFKTDAAMEIGTGHVMRCLALAYELSDRGALCTFIVGPTSIQVAPQLANSPFEIIIAKSLSDTDKMKSYFPHSVDWLVIDDYRLDNNFETACRSWANRIFIIDDLANRRHDCDLLLDQTPGREPISYANLTPKYSKLLLGSKYALIRTEFSYYRDASVSKKRQNIKRILVSLGGLDPEDITSSVIEGIARSELDNPVVDIVLGAASPNLRAVESLINTTDLSCNMHIDTSQMAKLMSKADLAIGAGGVSSLERCCLGLPSLLLILASNQIDNGDMLESVGAAMVINSSSDKIRPWDIEKRLNIIYKDPYLLEKMSKCSNAICDGQGTSRVAEKLLTIINE